MTARTGDKVLVRLRRCCLALPGTTETSSWGHPNFRTGKRTFAAFERIKDRPSIAVRLDAATVDLLLTQHGNFFATPYGRGVWVSVPADSKIDWPLVEDLIERAYRDAAPTRRATPGAARAARAERRRR